MAELSQQITHAPPEPYGAGFEEQGGALDGLRERLEHTETQRIQWGQISWWIPMRFLRQSFGLMLALAAVVGILFPQFAPQVPWQVLVVWLPLLALAFGPSNSAADWALKAADARFELSAQEGNDRRSAPGSDRIMESLRDARRNSHLTIAAGLAGISLLTFATMNEPNSLSWNLVLMIASALGLGTTVYSRLTMDDVLNHADPLPFLALHAPTHHPTELSPALANLVRAHLDPILGGEWDKWVNGLAEWTGPGLHREEALERLLLLLHLHGEDAIDADRLKSELSEFLTAEGIRGLEEEEVFNQAMLHRMIAHSRAWQPGLFHVISRLQGDLLKFNNNISSNDWRMDVEFEVECFDGQGHLFIALNNQRFDTDRVRVDVHVPGGSPEHQSFRLEGASCIAPPAPLPLFSDEEEDVIDWLPRYLRRGIFLWLGVSWKAGEVGLRSLQVTLHSDEGDLLASQLVRTKVHRRMGSGDRRRRRRLRRARTLGLSRTRKA